MSHCSGAKCWPPAVPAGGLRMSVHGLVYDMTVRAAQEAALGAGAILKMVTAGVMQEPELDALRQLEPNIILLAGGVEHGDQSTVVENARRLARLKLAAPIIYAGNSAARPLVQQILPKPASGTIWLRTSIRASMS